MILCRILENGDIFDGKNLEFAGYLKFVRMHKSFGGIEQRREPPGPSKCLMSFVHAG